MNWECLNRNFNGNRLDKVARRTTCIKNVKFLFAIINITTGCQHVGYFHYSENLHWAAQNLRLGRRLDTAVLVCIIILESYIFRQISAKFFQRQRAALLWRLSFRMGSFTNDCLQPAMNRFQSKRWRSLPGVVYLLGTCLGMFIVIICLFIADTKSIVWTHTLCRTQVEKADNTERSTRHWSRRNHRVTDTFCNCIEGRTIGLQTHS